ncbi:MAG: hypothetical protein AAF628_20860 [Planctomycetota bacterium]
MSGTDSQFCDEVCPPVGRGKIVATVVLTLAVVLVANAASWLYLRTHAINPTNFVLREKWRLLRDLEAPVDTLVLGDSSGSRSLLPAMLEEGLGGRALNVSTIAAMLTVAEAWMLEEYIDRFGPPRRVLISHSYDVWCRPYHAFLDEQLMEAGFSRDQAMAARPARLWTHLQVLGVRLKQAFPLYAQPTSLRKLVTTPWSLESPQHAGLGPKGFLHIDLPSPEQVRAERRHHVRWLEQSEAEPFAFQDLNLEGLRAIDSMATEHGFPVFLIDAPLFEGLVAEPVWRRHYAQIRAVLEQFVAAANQMQLLFPGPVGFGSDQMENVNHLTATAARDWTARVLERVKG